MCWRCIDEGKCAKPLIYVSILTNSTSNFCLHIFKLRGIWNKTSLLALHSLLPVPKVRYSFSSGGLDVQDSRTHKGLDKNNLPDEGRPGTHFDNLCRANL